MPGLKLTIAFDAVMGPNGPPHGGGQLVTLTKSKPKEKKPSLWDVFMLNDDFTTVDFVRGVLRRHFQKSEAEADNLTNQVHRRGIALAGSYTFEIADMKATLVMDEARKREFPFKLILEQRP